MLKLFLISFFFTHLLTGDDTVFSERAAVHNDWLIKKGEEKPIIKPVTMLTSRAMSVTVFPLCAALDIALLGAKQVYETPRLLLNKNSQLHKERYCKNAEALKSASLGLLTAPLGILSPDIVTHHFVPHNKIQMGSVKPYGKLYETHAEVFCPESIEDIQAIIHYASEKRRTVSILGKGMSQGKQAIANEDGNVVINTSKLNHITIDPEQKTAKVGAGTSWKELQQEANKLGLAVKVMQASNVFSIGGSISANCHGWDFQTGCLRNTLLDVTIVDCEGIVSRITPKDVLFDYIVGGYGAFGVIAEATISLTDNVKMVEHGVEVSPKDYLTYFNQHIRGNDIDMHLYRLSLEPKRLFQSGIAVNYQKVSDEPFIANLVDEPEFGSRMDRIKMHTIRRLPWVRNLAWNVVKNGALEERIATRNEIMRPPINPIFNDSHIDTEWLQEYFVKGEDLADFLQFLGRLLEKNNVSVFNASVRYVKCDPNTKLSYARDGERFAIVLFFNQNLSPKEVLKTKGWVREVIDYLIAHEGTYYLPYQHFATLEQFRACYPDWESIAAQKPSLFNNGLYEDYVSAKKEESLFRKVFDRVGGQREGIWAFLHNIFMQLDEKTFFALMDSILENHKRTDEEIYTLLYKHVGKAKSNAISHTMQSLKSLKCLKNDLGVQTTHLLNGRKVQGYVEIGYPGRMMHPLKSRMMIKGPLYAVTERQSFSDYVEAGFPLPYDRFIALDYEPISEIPTESVDLVCMYIGLHHCPKEKLGSFIASIKRILRPGGTFILMDHDAYTPELQNLADVVHSIFNAATGVEPAVNEQEIRNFQPLQYWIVRLEAEGFKLYPHKPLIRSGDSTLNSLIRFDKPGEEKIALNEEHSRPLIQTYLTAPEWQNVRAAQRYAAFLETEPAYRYPYFREIGSFWKVYGNSWQSAQKESGFWNVALAEYNFMNLFVGTAMTLEYGIKGVISAPFALFDSGKKKSPRKIPTDEERLRSLKEYGNFIENVPFYEYPYFQDIGSYWKTYWKKNRSFGSGVVGLISGIGMTVEYTLKGIVSTPMSFLYGSESLKESETTHLIISDPENHIETIDQRISVIKVFSGGLKHIELPRYMHFTEIMQKIAEHPSVSCVNIAGHEKIQVDVRFSRGQEGSYAGARVMYAIPVPTDLKNIYNALEVNVGKLCEVIRTLKKDKGEVLFIHDY